MSDIYLNEKEPNLRKIRRRKWKMSYHFNEFAGNRKEKRQAWRESWENYKVTK